MSSTKDRRSSWQIWGAGGCASVQRWFNSMFTSVAHLGVTLTAIGAVTPDAASVGSVLSRAALLQNRV
jgi:hypothetical protein